MLEIHVVRKDNRHLYERYFDPYFRLRHDIYVKQRKWMDLDRPDGREIDQFDTEDAVYLFCLDNGQLIGAMRALPTLLPTLMSDIFGLVAAAVRALRLESSSARFTAAYRRHVGSRRAGRL